MLTSIIQNQAFIICRTVPLFLYHSLCLEPLCVILTTGNFLIYVCELNMTNTPRNRHHFSICLQKFFGCASVLVGNPFPRLPSRNTKSSCMRLHLHVCCLLQNEFNGDRSSWNAKRWSQPWTQTAASFPVRVRGVGCQGWINWTRAED